jgi:hypothetical protein
MHHIVKIYGGNGGKAPHTFLNLPLNETMRNAAANFQVAAKISEIPVVTKK